ncbi:DNA polymerase eta [Clonorchis sinensis]|uniref:DNA polymerase eta n=1 Tax=Clonorchis sinensis TaxID=79923 RepID=A0A8T1MIC4_CLOSI|nr:DNA polymerase eta [Clonorchis sinensis]
MNRIVLLIDMDCFYVQVEQRSRPETLGKPCAVAQYNGETGGGIIAVSYEARAEGVKRGMWGKTAISVCPNLILFEVPEKRGKADLAKYRSASAEVFQCISEHFKDVERASIDEAYVDLTELVTSTVQQIDWTKSGAHQRNSESFVVIDSGSALEASANGMCAALDRLDWVNYLEERFNDGLRYAVATELTHKLRQTILTRTGFRCSAGIAPNKTLAKLACSLNKPNKQTIVPPESAELLLRSTSIGKIRNLGGKLGVAIMERFGIQTLGQLTEISLTQLTEVFGEKTAQWLYELCRGHDPDAVTPRSIAQSVGCSKNFVGRSILTSTQSIEYWLRCLSDELVERLIDDRRIHQRHATRLTLYVRTAEPVHLSTGNSSGSNSFSRVLPNAVLAEIRSTDPDFEPETFPVVHSDTDKILKLVAHRIAGSALTVMEEVFGSGKQNDTWTPGITSIGLSAAKFYSDTTCGDIRVLLQRKSDLKRRGDSPKAVESDFQAQGADEGKTVIDPVRSAAGSSFFKRLHAAEVSEPPPAPQEQKTIGPAKVDLPKPISDLPDGTSEQFQSKSPAFEIEPDTDSMSSNHTESGAFFTAYTAGDWTVCEECGSRVSVWQIPEHSDFHVAQRVQNEWVRESAGSSASLPSFPRSSGNSRSGRGRARVSKSASKTRGTGALDRFVLRR